MGKFALYTCIFAVYICIFVFGGISIVVYAWIFVYVQISIVVYLKLCLWIIFQCCLYLNIRFRRSIYVCVCLNLFFFLYGALFIAWSYLYGKIYIFVYTLISCMEKFTLLCNQFTFIFHRRPSCYICVSVL